MSRLIMMCGIPGSGKSTWIQNCKHFISNDVIVVSRDAIRFSMLKEDEDYFAHEPEVFKEFIAEIGTGLKEHEVVIADATHLNSASRTKVLRALGENLKGVNLEIVVVEVPLEIAFEQNDKREGLSWVKHGIIRRMFFSLEMPTIEEGFNRIYIYKPQSIENKYTIIERE